MTTAAGQEPPPDSGTGGGNGQANGPVKNRIPQTTQLTNGQHQVLNHHSHPTKFDNYIIYNNSHYNQQQQQQQLSTNIIYNNQQQQQSNHNHNYKRKAMKSNYNFDDQFEADQIIRRNFSEDAILKDGWHNDKHYLLNDQGENNSISCQEDDNNSDEESLSEALLAVASAEEYAAKITKLQQACLTPLKEDLADWLNKILETSTMTTDNFMDKLDNGVIICRLAKIISLWCAQQFETDNVHSTSSNCKLTDAENYDRPIPPPVPRPRLNPIANGPLRTTSSQSTNCLTSAQSTTSLNYLNGNNSAHSNQFLDNLTRMHHAKIWEDAKGRTFYARDNVCNFIRWSRGFGVNQSVLFESDDLVLHANPRQVVLCLLDVARIAYVRYSFTEAPGLVKFEQEIDKELVAAAEKAHQLDMNLADSSNNAINLNRWPQSCGVQPKESSRAKNSLRSLSIGDATDELIMRYCKHKKEEEARKKSEQLQNLNNGANCQLDLSQVGTAVASSSKVPSLGLYVTEDSSKSSKIKTNHDELTANLPLSDLNAHNKKCLVDTGHIDSLDSGQGPTESASTGHSARSMIKSPTIKREIDDKEEVDESRQGKQENSSSSVTSQQSSSMTNSEISSSRSSLLSNQDVNNQSSGYGRQITSDLDGKVMRIAKSYYGKGATKDVTRLSEGKYKIADRIVFVRLLKGHRVMVRIGGGWDTLENFLFRHKSDPSQVIDVDNLLPIETKMSFEKSPQVTPTNSRLSKLPYYRRSNSASSTNLSISNLSISNHSIASTTTPSHKAPGGGNVSGLPKFYKHQTSSSVQSSPAHHYNRRSNQVSHLLMHKEQQHHHQSIDYKHNTPQHNSNASYNKNGHRIFLQTTQVAAADSTTTTTSLLKRPVYFHKTTPISNKYTLEEANGHHQRFKHNQQQRPLASSRAPASSASNLFPLSLTTRTLTPSSSSRPMGVPKLLSSAGNLNNTGGSKIK